MSYTVKNGELVATKALPRGVSAPTPAQIAERAYDLATEAALVAVALNPAPDAATVRAFMFSRRPVDLAALRQSIINPPAIPWWKK